MRFIRFLMLLLCAAALSFGSDAEAGGKKPAKKKAVPTLDARLKAAGLRVSVQRFGKDKNLVNRYAELPPTTRPSPPGTRKPKKVRNTWAIIAQPMPVVDAEGRFDKVTQNTLALMQSMRERPQRNGGLIVVYLDPASPGAAEAFAELAAKTQRTVTAVNCDGMPGNGVDCRHAFSKWGMPKLW